MNATELDSFIGTLQNDLAYLRMVIAMDAPPVIVENQRRVCREKMGRLMDALDQYGRRN